MFYYPAPGRGTGYCNRTISFFISLFLCLFQICMKFSGKVWSNHGTTWFNFGSMRVNGSAGQVFCYHRPQLRLLPTSEWQWLVLTFVLSLQHLSSKLCVLSLVFRIMHTCISYFVFCILYYVFVFYFHYSFFLLFHAFVLHLFIRIKWMKWIAA